MIIEIIQGLWLFLPAALANMVLPLFVKLKFLDIPLDFGKSFRGKRIFGDHKTFKGIVIGTIIAILMVYLQKVFYLSWINYSLIDYSSVNVVLLGLALGLGSLLGDAVKSFFKRQLEIAPGKPWIPFDQIDWIIGSMIFVSFLVEISLIVGLWVFIFYGALHFIANLAGYYLRINKEKL
tara:strand:- start:3454 stop:3990 length:537 start_codon:yes stop_codon:yes gene_type:complete